jgi:hypothetical protein
VFTRPDKPVITQKYSIAKCQAQAELTFKVYGARGIPIESLAEAVVKVRINGVEYVTNPPEEMPAQPVEEVSEEMQKLVTSLNHHKKMEEAEIAELAGIHVDVVKKILDASRANTCGFYHSFHVILEDPLNTKLEVEVVFTVQGEGFRSSSYEAIGKAPVDLECVDYRRAVVLKVSDDKAPKKLLPVELDIETKLRVFEPCAPIEADATERDEMGPSPQKKLAKSQSTLAGLAVNGLEHSLSNRSLQTKPTKKVMSPKVRKAVL